MGGRAGERHGESAPAAIQQGEPELPLAKPSVPWISGIRGAQLP